jgi:sigma-B regulation protein RsbU (phosphoserine phosphatase)
MAKAKSTCEVLVVSREPTLLPELREALRQRGLFAEVTDDEARLGDASLIVVDHRGLAESALAKLLQEAAERVVLLTEQEDKDNVNHLFARYPLCHLIGLNGRSYLNELVVTVRKRLTGELWGLAPYMDPTAKAETVVIQAAEDINDTIESLLNHADLQASFSSTLEFLRMTANELVTNAVYNAPVDGDGKPKYEQTDRKVKVKLEPSEFVTISVASDDQRIAISVSDLFGRLDRDKIVRHFVKCVNNTKFIENKKGGAGAGVYLAYYMASQFIVNVEPGRRLEMLCILEKNKRYKEYRQRVTSFNYFSTTQGKVLKIGGAA